jgi:hypothetical protein
LAELPKDNVGGKNVMVKRNLFEFFDAEKIKLTVIKGRNKGARKVASEYERALDDFAESDKGKTGVWYHGKSKRLSIFAAALRGFAQKKGYRVSVAVAETADGKKAILLSKLAEAEFKEMQEDELNRRKSK